MKTRTIKNTVLAILMSFTALTAGAQEHYHSHTIYGGYINLKFANLKDKTSDRYDYPYNGGFLGWRYNIKPRKDRELFINVGAEFGWVFNHDSYDTYTEDFEQIIRVMSSTLHKYSDFKIKGKGTQSNYQRHMNFCGIKLPLDISYNFKVNGTKLAFRPFIGIHAGVILYGHTKEDYDYSMTYTFVDFPDLGEYTESDNVHTSNSLLGNEDEDYNEDAIKRIYGGWQAGVNIAYDRYSIGFTFENELLQMSNYYKSRTISVNFAYTFK